MIVEIDGKQVESMDDVIAVVDSKKPGDEVELRVAARVQEPDGEGEARRAPEQRWLERPGPAGA